LAYKNFVPFFVPLCILADPKHAVISKNTFPPNSIHAQEKKNKKTRWSVCIAGFIMKSQNLTLTIWSWKATLTLLTPRPSKPNQFIFSVNYIAPMGSKISCKTQCICQ